MPPPTATAVGSADQANLLRELVRREAGHRDPCKAGPPLVAVMGASPGAGATTVATRLALAVGHAGLRPLLIGGRAAPAAANSSDGLNQVLAGRRKLEEALLDGPHGLLHLPAGNGTTGPGDPQQLLSQLAGIGARADLVLADVPAGRANLVEACWQAASLVLVVLTPDPVAILGGYAAIKRFAPRTVQAELQIVVNRADAPTAETVYGRIEDACREYLQLQVRAAGHLPFDVTLGRQADVLTPKGPDSDTPTGHPAVESLARRVLLAIRGRTSHSDS